MRRVAITLFTLAIVAPAGAPIGAQVMSAPRAGTMVRAQGDAADRAVLGISTAPGGMRDTLGLLVSSITSDGPAEKAGVLEGDRLQAINGVNLRLRPDDAGDPSMRGINQNRLTREMRKVRPGDDVTLVLWGDGRTRTVKVHATSAESLSAGAVTFRFDTFRAGRDRMGGRMGSTRDDDRAVLGVYLRPTGTKRDTMGVFVQEVVEGGPAEKAGVVEGDRVASINDVDLRVAREDAGDPTAASARVDRMQREMDKLKVGDVATLEVVSGGRTRTLKVTTAKPDDMPGMGRSTFDVRPRIEIRRRMDDADITSQFEGRLRDLMVTLRSRGSGIRMTL